MGYLYPQTMNILTLFSHLLGGVDELPPVRINPATKTSATATAPAFPAPLTLMLSKILVAIIAAFIGIGAGNDIRDAATGGVPVRPQCALWSVVRPTCR